MTPLELRTKVIESRQMFGRGEISIDELHAAADKYIESLREFKLNNKHAKKLPIPSRAYLLRAL